MGYFIIDLVNILHFSGQQRVKRQREIQGRCKIMEFPNNLFSNSE
jgi:hypothetical protein